MLTTLASVKFRLALLDTDTQYDALLTATIRAISARFDQETHRTLARTENAIFEFDPDDTEICVPCYPIETVTGFQYKTSETTGWQEIAPAPDYLIRSTCILSLPVPFHGILGGNYLDNRGDFRCQRENSWFWPSPAYCGLPDPFEG